MANSEAPSESSGARDPSLEDTQLGEGPADAVGVEGTPTRIGRFVVLRELGRGGMGVVYAAYDNDLDRRVAVKVLHRAEGQATKRMRREAQAMARVVHPNVATIHEVGVWDGQTFLAMEFVDGESLKTWLERGGHALERVLDVLLQSGEGLAAAHAAGLVHRDFKPDNVMIGHDGRVRVLDFGLAGTGTTKVETPTEGEVAAYLESHGSSSSNVLDTPLTETGALMGTPAYMSPEQFRGDAVGPSSDQFSLAKTCFEALYGTKAFQGNNGVSLAFAALSGKLEPPPPGSSVPRGVHGVLKRALAAKPEGRFPDVRTFMHELAGAFEAPRRARRQRRRVGLGLAAALVVVLGVVLTRSAMAQRAEAEAVALREAANAAQARRAEQAQERRRHLAEIAGHNALLRSVAGAEPVASVQAAALRESVGPSPLRGSGSEVLRSAMSASPWSETTRIASDVHGRARPHDYAASEDGRWSVRAYDDGTVTIVDADGDEDQTTLPRVDGSIYRVATCNDAEAVAAIVGYERAVMWRRRPSGDYEGPIALDFDHRIKRVAIDAQCRHVALGSHDGTIGLFDVTGAAAPRELSSHGNIGLAFSPDGRRLASAQGDRINIFDLANERVRSFEGVASGIRGVSFSNDGRRLVAAALDDTVRLLTLDGSEPPVLLAHDVQMRAACFTSDDRWIISSSMRGRVFAWDLTDPDQPHEILERGRRVNCARGRAQFNVGDRIFRPGTVGATIFATGGWTDSVHRGETRRTSPVAFSADGRDFASKTYVIRGIGAWGTDYFGRTRFFQGAHPMPKGVKRHQTIVRVVPVRQPYEPRTTFVVEGLEWFHAVQFSPDGTLLAAVSEEGRLYLWERASPEKPPRVLSASSSDTTDVAFSPDGTLVATVDEDHAVRLWSAGETTSASEPRPVVLRGHTDDVWSVTWSPDGKQLSTTSMDGTVRVWGADGTVRHVIEGQYPRLMRAPFNADGTRLATSTPAHDVHVYPLDDVAHPMVLEGHTGRVSTLTFSADGEHVLSGSADRTVRRWSLADGTSQVFEGHAADVISVAASPEGERFASASLDGTARVWDPTSSAAPLILPARGAATFVEFSPDGRYLGTNARDAEVWDLERWASPRAAMWSHRYCESPSRRRALFGESTEVASAHHQRCVDLTEYCADAALADCRARVDELFEDTADF